MPYLARHIRDQMTGLGARLPVNAGELNYAITRLLISYWGRRDHHYQEINDILGALEGAKLEFYRRVVAPYEDEKIVENGDVYNG